MWHFNMKYLQSLLTHWKTSTGGIITILFALWLMEVRYVPTNTLYFNVVYVWPESFFGIVAGIALIYAKDHDK